MSYMLQHLHNGWQVDQAILSEEDRVVVSGGAQDGGKGGITGHFDNP